MIHRIIATEGIDTLYGPLGIRADDRYRNVAEARVIESIAFMGWLHEDDRDVARSGASQALKRFIDLGLGFRSTHDGQRYFDLVEVNNFMRSDLRGDFYSSTFVPALRRLVSDAISDSPRSKQERRFAIDFKRTFDLRSLPIGSKVRLRAPLPRIGETLYDLDVRPHEPNAPDVRVEHSQGRIEARGLVPSDQTMTLGARLKFSAEFQQQGERFEKPSDQVLATYLREREGLVVVTPRIAGLAASITAQGTSAFEAMRSVWDHICRAFRLDCRLAASLLVALHLAGDAARV